MTNTIKDAILSAKLQPGDRVRFVSPASSVSVDGLSIGHGKNPIALPIGTKAVLDTDTGILTVAAGVR